MSIDLKNSIVSKIEPLILAARLENTGHQCSLKMLSKADSSVITLSALAIPEFPSLSLSEWSSGILQACSNQSEGWTTFLDGPKSSLHYNVKTELLNLMRKRPWGPCCFLHCRLLSNPVDIYSRFYSTIYSTPSGIAFASSQRQSKCLYLVTVNIDRYTFTAARQLSTLYASREWKTQG